MQKWEYLVVELTNEGNWVIAQYVNEQELEGWKNIPYLVLSTNLVKPDGS